MDLSETNFDYQIVLETCGLQGENVKKATEKESQTSSNYHNEYNNFKKLKEEWKNKSETLFELQLTQKRNLQKLDSIADKQLCINKEIAELQDETSSVHSELQKLSDDFLKKIAALDEDLQNLYSQFEGEALSNLIKEVSAQLSASEDVRQHLQKEYDKIKNCQVNLDAYTIHPVVKVLTNELDDNQNPEAMEMELNERKKNILFLTTEIDKLKQTHQI